MKKFKSVSWSEIGYELKELKVTPTYEVEIDTEFLKDTITITADKEDIEAVIEKALESKNSKFWSAQKEAKDKILEKRIEEEIKG